MPVRTQYHKLNQIFYYMSKSKKYIEYGALLRAGFRRSVIDQMIEDYDLELIYENQKPTIIKYKKI